MSTLPNLPQVLPNLPQNKEITMMNIMEKSENITDINQTILKVIHYATHHVTDWNHLEQLFKRLQLSPSEQLQ